MTGPHKLLDAAMTNKDNMIEFGEMVNESHMSRDLYDELAEHISQANLHLSRIVQALDGGRIERAEQE